MMSSFSPVYFADENALGLAKLLIRQGRDDTVHPGHPGVPGIPSEPSISIGCRRSVQLDSS